MIDHALNKRVLEYCNHPRYMTMPGDDETYNTLEGGYLGIHHPAFVTVDLEQVVAIKQVSMKLIDWEDELNLSEPKKQNQHYAYRLLCSTDKETWQVLYDSTCTDKVYRRGWQWGVFKDVINARYFRVHALHNPANSGFHIVRLRLFDEENLELQRGDKLEFSSSYPIEKGDATPLSAKMMNMVQQLAYIVPEDNKESEEYKNLVDDILNESMTFESVDGRVDQFRQIITPHIAKSLEDDYRKESKNNIINWIVSAVILGLNIVFNFFDSSNHILITILRWTCFAAAMGYSIYIIRTQIAELGTKLYSKLKRKQQEENCLDKDINILQGNILAATQRGGDKVPDFLFGDEVVDYNTKEGFHNIPNPGWLEIQLKEAKEISYLRFLLWDNCGSKKKQPSHRKYHYRLMLAEEPAANEAMVWDVVYDNSHNPSNGWQEFFFEDSCRKIKAIRIQFFHTLALSSSNNEKTVTQLVSIQAYKNPTEGICKWSEAGNRLPYAPALKGLSKNRIVIGGSDAQIGELATNQISNKIFAYLQSISNNLEESKKVLVENFKEDLSHDNNKDISKQINLFYNSVLKPVDEQKATIRRKSSWISCVTVALLSIEFLDISNKIKMIILLSLILFFVLLFSSLALWRKLRQPQQ